jgi:hypothetical protein
MRRIGLAISFLVMTVASISLQEGTASAYGDSWIIGSGLFQPPHLSEEIFAIGLPFRAWRPPSGIPMGARFHWARGNLGVAEVFDGAEQW